jgi:hypothetical protein
MGRKVAEWRHQVLEGSKWVIICFIGTDPVLSVVELGKGHRLVPDMRSCVYPELKISDRHDTTVHIVLIQAHRNKAVIFD